MSKKSPEDAYNRLIALLFVAFFAMVVGSTVVISAYAASMLADDPPCIRLAHAMKLAGDYR